MKILFLGGSHSQLPIIKFSKYKGHYIIVAGNRENNPGTSIAHEYYNISTLDTEAILKLSENLKIDAISAFSSDPSSLTEAIVSEKLGLIGNPPDAVRKLSNKFFFRKLQAELGLNYPVFKQIKVIDDLLSAEGFDEAILKPVDSSGSKGIIKINCKSDLNSALKNSIRYSPSGECILEELIETNVPQIHGEGFVIDGQLSFTCLGDQYFCSFSPFSPVSTTFPSTKNADFIGEVISQVQKILTATGYKTGGINIEAIRDKNNNIILMEIGPRSGGNLMPSLVQHATGFNIFEATLLNKRGDKVGVKNIGPDALYSQVILHSHRDGIFLGLRKSEIIQKYLIEETLFINEGMNVRAYKNSGDVIGIFILRFPSIDVYQSFFNNHAISDLVLIA